MPEKRREMKFREANGFGAAGNFHHGAFIADCNGNGKYHDDLLKS
jgi:hypothetical protein